MRETDVGAKAIVFSQFVNFLDVGSSVVFSTCMVLMGDILVYAADAANRLPNPAGRHHLRQAGW